MDPQLIITGLAGAVSALAVTIFKMQNATIAELKDTIKQQLQTQDATTKTLQKVVDVGMERLRSEPPEGGP